MDFHTTVTFTGYRVTCQCLNIHIVRYSYKYTTHYSTLNHNIIQQSSYLQDHNCRDYVLNSKVKCHLYKSVNC